MSNIPDADDLDSICDGPRKVRAFGLTRIYPDAAAIRARRRRISAYVLCAVLGGMLGGLFAWAAACLMGVL